MGKWADYLFGAVCYDQDGKAIDEVQVHEAPGGDSARTS